MTVIKIQSMELRHVDQVVSVHLHSFPDFFLTFLGPSFLHLLYSEILTTPDSVALIALDNEQVVGFVVGVARQSSFYSRLIQHRLLTFVHASLGAVIRRPSIVLRLCRALTYPRSSQDAIAQALLMSIAVVPGAAGAGIGQQLVKAFLADMQAKNIRSVSLTTDRDNNDRTNRFYQKLGFELTHTFTTPEGRTMNEYIIYF